MPYFSHRIRTEAGLLWFLKKNFGYSAIHAHINQIFCLHSPSYLDLGLSFLPTSHTNKTLPKCNHKKINVKFSSPVTFVLPLLVRQEKRKHILKNKNPAAETAGYARSHA